jgi:hypothetical protein
MEMKMKMSNVKNIKEMNVNVTKYINNVLSNEETVVELTKQRNKFSELHNLHIERDYYNATYELNYDDHKFIKWKYNLITGYNTRLNSLMSDLSDIERYVETKRRRLWIPEVMENPFFYDLKNSSSTINFKAAGNTNKTALELTGKSKKEYETIMGMINKVNKNRTIPASDKYHVSISPLRDTLRSPVIKNSFAMKIVYPDGSISVFLFFLNRFHIATNVV